MSLRVIRGEKVDMPHGAVMGAELIDPHQRNRPKPYYDHAGKYGNIYSCLVEKTTTDFLTLDASRPAILSSKLKPQHTGRRSLPDKRRHGRQSDSECL